MVYRVVVALFVCLALSRTASSQSLPVTDVTNSMLTWVKHLDSDVDKYATKDKAKELSLNFEALKRDLTIYMKNRKRLSDSLLRKNVAPGKKDPENLELLKTQMGNVMSQMRNVTDLTNNELRSEGDRLNDEIYNALNGDKTQYLSYLEAFLDGLEVSKKDMALDGSVCYNRLEQCISILSSIQGKVDRKMK